MSKHDLFTESKVIEMKDGDHLIEDPELPGQKYVLLSFAEPRFDRWEQKQLYHMTKFLHWFYTQSLFHPILEMVRNTVQDSLTEAQLSALQSKIETNLTSELLQQRHMESEKDFSFSIRTVTQRFEDYKELHTEENEALFKKETTPELCTHGVKVRGVFPTLAEANEYALMLRKQQIEPYIDVFVTEMGKWVPKRPFLNQIEAAYTDEWGNEMTELNLLMKNLQQQDSERKTEFHKRKQL